MSIPHKGIEGSNPSVSATPKHMISRTRPVSPEDDSVTAARHSTGAFLAGIDSTELVCRGAVTSSGSRKAAPVDLAASVRSTDVRRSLRTRSPPFARQRARPALIVIEEAFGTLSRQHVTTDRSRHRRRRSSGPLQCQHLVGTGRSRPSFRLAAFGITPMPLPRSPRSRPTAVPRPRCRELAIHTPAEARRATGGTDASPELATAS